MKRTILITITVLLILSVILAPSVMATPLVISVNYAQDTSHEPTLPEPTSSAEWTKEEVIYAVLENDGNVNGIYVVNIFNVNKPGNITDVGSYDKVKNLTNMDELKVSKDSVSMTLSEGKFYYQGNPSSSMPLPWNVSIGYILNGKSISANEMAGESGNMSLRIKTTRGKALDPSFFDNYMLQISVTLNTEICSSVVAEGATIANAGKNKTINFTAMPQTDGDFVVSADVKDFEMAGISFAAIPFSMALDLPNTDQFSEDLSAFTEAVNTIDDGMFAIKSGLVRIKNGAKELQDGSQKFLDGLIELDSNSATLVDASSQINSGLDAIGRFVDIDVEKLESIDMISIETQLKDFREQLIATLEAIDSLTENASLINRMDGPIDALSSSIAEADLVALKEKCGDDPVLNALIANYYASQTIKNTYDEIAGSETSAADSLNMLKGAIEGAIELIDGIIVKIEDAKVDIEKINGIADSVKGLLSLPRKYKEFHEGLVLYTNGVGELAKNYPMLHEGISAIARGLGAAASGSGELSVGVSQFNDETKDLPNQVTDMIDGITDSYDFSDFIQRSFISAQNKNVTAVQFVFITEGIFIEKYSEAQAKEQPASFVDKLLALLG